MGAIEIKNGPLFILWGCSTWWRVKAACSTHLLSECPAPNVSCWSKDAVRGAGLLLQIKTSLFLDCFYRSKPGRPKESTAIRVPPHSRSAAFRRLPSTCSYAFYNVWTRQPVPSTSSVLWLCILLHALKWVHLSIIVLALMFCWHNKKRCYSFYERNGRGELILMQVLLNAINYKCLIEISP